MAAVDAVIRPYVHREDDKLVRFTIGKSRMEPLAVANRTATTHPVTLVLWILAAAILVEFAHWWPTGEFGYIGYLRPLPAFAVTGLPIAFAIDWWQREAFDDDSMQVLKRPDIVDIEEYYARSPASGVWILEVGDRFVGLVTVDASKDSLSDNSVTEQETPKQKSKKYSKGTSSTATIRHLYVDEQFRPAAAQTDLIQFAVNHVFGASKEVERIRISPSPLFRYLGKALREEGFVVVEKGEKVGVFRWTTLTYELTREKWNARRTL